MVEAANVCLAHGMRVAIATLAGLALSVTAARAETTAVCEQAARAAETAWHLPPGLLLAIGRVESGRWDATLRRVVPFPWSLDAAGQGRQFASSQEAIAAARAAQAAGQRNLDIGCFQVNLYYHPDAFTDLATGFDPAANAAYAARFLVDLRGRLGSWPAAIAAYHSADPARGEPYRQLVYASWDDPASRAPLVAGVHVWTPNGEATGPLVVEIGIRGRAGNLPKVITPGG